ncbi:MAG: AraC family transcriptional regulator [Oscillospiraceae bacterium]|jgi:AraC family transcriptional regulator|nr:AraC family transcriptional regulator [Oscillospiraceae bacterium]
MDTTASLNAAMRYIEQRLFDEIDFTEMARIACCSEYQFRRMFSYLADMPLNEYIRKRRLSLAANLLHSGDEKIIDIAIKCGYESPDAFGKAFQSMYGVTPSALRKRAVTPKVFPPLFFHLTLKGGIEMEYRIVEKGAFYIMGKTGSIPLIYHGPNPHTADVWKKLRQEDLLVLMEYSEAEPNGVICAYGGNKEGVIPKEGDEHFMCVGVVMEKPMPDRFKGRFDVFSYEPTTWLVFSATENSKDSHILNTQQTYGRISEWLSTSEYAETGAPSMTWVETYDFSKPDRKSEIWVPVRKRA